MKQINRIIIGLAIGTGWTVVALAQGQKDWQAPDIGKLPDDKYGQMVRQGKALMEQTYKHIGPEVKDASKRFSGNNLACVSCHMDAGSRKFGNPWVGTFVSFPQYRGREDAVSTTEERINGCMERSMNGRKLPLESAEMKAMLSYLHFLSTGIPVGAKLEGGGTLKLKPLARAADPVAGKQVYATTCAACHGENGQGMRRGKVGDADGYQFPPVWGADSYNNGAGMARISSVPPSHTLRTVPPIPACTPSASPAPEASSSRRSPRFQPPSASTSCPSVAGRLTSPQPAPSRPGEPSSHSKPSRITATAFTRGPVTSPAPSIPRRF